MAKYLKGDNRINYYAQELKENTYNLTRMNLVMRGIDPANIYVRNGDTLEEDWPFFERFSTMTKVWIDVPKKILAGNPIIASILFFSTRLFLIVYSSLPKGYEKSGKSNRLRSSDIKRIVDCIHDRATIPGFSKRVSKDKVRENDYNLNISKWYSSCKRNA
mgnify:CR=1 FL=1